GLARSREPAPLPVSSEKGGGLRPHDIIVDSDLGLQIDLLPSRGVAVAFHPRVNAPRVVHVQRSMLHDAIAYVHDAQQAHGKGLTGDHCKMYPCGEDVRVSYGKLIRDAIAADFPITSQVPRIHDESFEHCLDARHVRGDDRWLTREKDSHVRRDDSRRRGKMQRDRSRHAADCTINALAGRSGRDLIDHDVTQSIMPDQIGNLTEWI